MLLEIDNLTKVYRKGVRANDGISIQVDAGQVLGLLGHNGAGKSTLLNQVVGSVKPTAGTIRIDGHDPVADPDLARRLCSLQPQAQVPFQGITPGRRSRSWPGSGAPAGAGPGSVPASCWRRWTWSRGRTRSGSGCPVGSSG